MHSARLPFRPNGGRGLEIAHVWYRKVFVSTAAPRTRSVRQGVYRSPTMQDTKKAAAVLVAVFGAGIVTGWLLNQYTRKVNPSDLPEHCWLSRRGADAVIAAHTRLPKCAFNARCWSAARWPWMDFVNGVGMHG